MRLYLDIETIPCNDAELVAEIAASITAPKTMSKPETIAKWEAEEKPGLVKEAVSKTAFDGGLGRVVCIGYALDEGAIQTRHVGSEWKVLNDFFGETNHLEGLQVVGHNVGWDIRFLWQRAVVHGMTRPRWLRAAAKAKPWDIEDTMLLWNPERDRKVSLDKLCKVLGVQTPKGDLDGSKVWAAFQEGRLAEIATYCAGDVAAVRACHQRMAA